MTAAPAPTAAELRERLRARLVLDEATGCLLWPRPLNHDGYGVIKVGEKLRKVHRVAWELEKGPIPEGLELDHVRDWGCRHRNCANVAHLEPVTHAENKRRALKTACKYGHAFTPENSVFSNGTRYCRACKRRSRREWDERMRYSGPLTWQELLAAQARRRRAEVLRRKAGTGASADRRVTRSAAS